MRDHSLSFRPTIAKRIDMRHLLTSNPNLTGQMLRYGVSGVLLTLFYSTVYWAVATQLGVPALIANSAAFVLTLATGWVIHSRWSFRGHGPRERPREAYKRFVLINLAGYALNSFWVWLIVERLGGSVLMSILPIVLITPWLMFWLNRRWTFA
jgi:putative flippase GtrA